MIRNQRIGNPVSHTLVPDILELSVPVSASDASSLHEPGEVQFDLLQDGLRGRYENPRFQR